jgi:hypothetical protein
VSLVTLSASPWILRTAVFLLTMTLQHCLRTEIADNPRRNLLLAQWKIPQMHTLISMRLSDFEP